MYKCFTCNLHWFVLVSFLSRCLWCSSLLLSSRERSRLNKPWCSSTSSNFSRYRPSISAANGERVTWKPCLPSTRKSDIGSMTTGHMGMVNIKFFLVRVGGRACEKDIYIWNYLLGETWLITCIPTHRLHLLKVLYVLLFFTVLKHKSTIICFQIFRKHAKLSYFFTENDTTAICSIYVFHVRLSIFFYLWFRPLPISPIVFWTPRVASWWKILHIQAMEASKWTGLEITAST